MMKKALTGLAIVAGLAGAARAQTPGTSTYTVTLQRRAATEEDLQAVMGKVRATVETRVTKGVPYAADAVTEFVQVLSDGNRIVRKTTTRVYRDSEGRTRREQTVPGPNGEMLTVSISDPVEGASFVLEPETRTAWKGLSTYTLPRKVEAAGAGGGAGGGAGVGTGAVARRSAPSDDQKREIETAARMALTEGAREASGQMRAAAERAAAGEGTTTKEDLGEQTMEGVVARGTRTTTVIAAGSIGNDQPITIVSEQWFSSDLELFVATKHSDPRSGETSYRLLNIVRGEQDRSLFEVPADYTLKESGIRRQGGVMLRQR
jgi:hypothetical protein